MSATGALTTKMFVSPLRPTSRTQAGYEALDTRTITPSDLSSNVFTIPEADYVAVVSGDPTTISADIAPLVTGTTYYIIKLGSNTISLAEHPRRGPQRNGHRDYGITDFADAGSVQLESPRRTHQRRRIRTSV